MKLTLVILAALMGLLLTGSTVTESQAPRPNIILIFTDDQRWDALQTMPVVRGLQGMHFTNAFVTSPLCCPSRASILTGLYAHNTGVRGNRDIGLFNDSSTLATWLDAAGYWTSYIGKYLNRYRNLSPYIPPGWDDWEVFVEASYYNYDLNDNGTVVHYGSGAADYSTDVLRDRAVAGILAARRPFFMVLSPFAPHGAGRWPRGPLVAPRHQGTCGGLAPYRPPSFNEADVSDKPAFIQALPLLDPAQVDAFRRDQLCALKAVDEMVAAILEALGPEAQNTVLIFTSDNGYQWGEHRLWGKARVYEENLRVPLVIAYPPLTPASVTSAAFALNIDLAPTIAELAGVVPSLAPDGLSLVPLLTNPAGSLRVEFLTEMKWSAIRRPRYLYAEHPTGEVELYDFRYDPYQLENVAGDPAYASTRAWLAGRLAALRGE